MPQTKVVLESNLANPSALVELWSLDLTPIGVSTTYYFCNMSSNSCQPIVFNGISYTPFPIKGEGFALDGKGSIPRPKLTVSNINGFVSAMLLQNGQLNGAVVTRIRVPARFLDAANFQSPTPTWVTPDPTGSWPPEPWVVNRKVTENPQVVTFELSSPIELQNIKLPFRQIIANVCRWKYRQAGTCGYTGVPIADNANRTFTGYYGLTLSNEGDYDAGTTYNAGDYVVIYSPLPALANIPIVYVCIKNGTVGVTPNGNPANWVADSCPHNCAGCALRYPGQALRGSFFPGVSRSEWISRA